MLAEEFLRQGHEVRVITQTQRSDEAVPDAFPFELQRRPTAQRLLALVRWCDVYFHNNVSLPCAWPVLFVRRPWVVAHHVWIPKRGLIGRLKRLALRRAVGISISEAIASDLSTPSVIIPNPYDDATFRPLPDCDRDQDLIFVGRLVSDKGADLLISAVANLHARGIEPTVTIVGTGPEEAALREQAGGLGLKKVSFVGLKNPSALVRLLNAHRILVVPSRWQEPFGIVALEAIACGCAVAGSDGGGLRDAIGPCGATFPNGDVPALTDLLEEMLCGADRVRALAAAAEQHLQRHKLQRVAHEYLAVFARCLAVPGPRECSEA